MKASMAKRFLFIAILILSAPCLSAETIDYRNDYRGLVVNESTLDDAVLILGEPIIVSRINTTVRYRFTRVDISVYSNTGLINSIIIFDPSYVDKNGIRVGDPFDSVRYLPKVKLANSAIADQKNGIIYWFKNNRVTQIVLTGRLKALPQ